MPFNSSAASASGSRRMKEIAIENEADIKKVAADLIGDLKRPATAGEVVEAELIAVTLVKSRRLRLQSRDDSKERRILRDLMKSTVFGSVPAPPRVATNIFDRPRAPGAAAPEFRVAERGEVCLALPEGASDAG
jgi:hypothetical protein